MVDNQVLDIYDVGSGAFVKQATQGDIMSSRIGHCATRGWLAVPFKQAFFEIYYWSGSAYVNGAEQHQIFVYGGQTSNSTTLPLENLSSDMYILTLPSYTWTHVGNNLLGQPPARASHTCDLIGDQMVRTHSDFSRVHSPDK